MVTSSSQTESIEDRKLSISVGETTPGKVVIDGGIPIFSPVRKAGIKNQP
jgi:hypothetical protein